MPEDSDAVVAGPGAPCGACRWLRRGCVPGCVFAPYFSAEDFEAVHRFYGASNSVKLLSAVELPEQRRLAAASLIEAARARVRDPTFGQVSYIRILQEVNDKASEQVDEVRAEIAREFGALAASEPVDVAAASPAVRVEARAQVDAALKHAKELDARLLGVRNANEARWRELHPESMGMGTEKEKHAAGNGKGKGVDVKRHREHTLSEKAMPKRRAAKQRSSRPPGFPDERSHQQIAVAEAEREKALLMRQAASAKQNGYHHLAAQHGETTEPPRVPEMSEAQQLTAAAEASREEAMRSVQTPAAAPQRLGSAGTPKQGSTLVLLEAMMQLAGAGTGDEQHHQQQFLVAQTQHAENEHGVSITQGFLQLHEFYDMAELARKQEIMRNNVMTEMGQWDAAAGVATEQDVMTMMMQQIPANNTWQHQDPVPQYAGFRNGHGPQEMTKQMQETSTAELAQTTGNNMAQQFAWPPQQYHDPAAVHHASPWQWLHQMAEAHQPAAAAASASQLASEQDMLLLLQQHHQVAAAEFLSPDGARQFDNLAVASQYDGTDLTLGYGHPGMHQQVAAAGQQIAAVQDVNAAVLAEREMMMQLAASQQQQHARNGLDDVAHGNGHPDGDETEAMVQELYALSLLELAGKQETIVKQQGVTTEMAQWDAHAASGVAWEQDVMMTQHDPEAAWLQEALEKIEKDESSMPDLANKNLGNGYPDGSTQGMGILQSQELFAQAETVRKLEMLMRQVAAAGRAREQEIITQQTAAAQQHSGIELDISMGQGHGHPGGSTQGILQSPELFAQAEIDRKLEMLMRKVAAAGRAREQEMIALQQAAAAQQQQHPVAQQYSGTELDISLGQGHGHPYWHQPKVQQMLQEKQLPTVQEQQLAYVNGEHGSRAGSTMAFLSPGSAQDAPFVVDQQPQPNGHQMNTSLLPLPLPSSLSQLHA